MDEELDLIYSDDDSDNNSDIVGGKHPNDDTNDTNDTDDEEQDQDQGEDQKEEEEVEDEVQEEEEEEEDQEEEDQEEQREESSEFLPYPSFDQEDFYDVIYKKKEFNKTKVDSSEYNDILRNPDLKEQALKKMCSQSSFDLQPYQEFIKNYISTETNYNSVLQFWGVGTGKCLHKNTLINLYNGNSELIETLEIQQIFNKYKTSLIYDTINSGIWSKPSTKLYVQSYDTDTNEFVFKEINNLYTEHFKGSLIKIITCDKFLIGTPEHRVYTNNNKWVQLKNLTIGDCIKTIQGSQEIQEIQRMEIQEMAMIMVYDLEIDQTHCYIANEIVSHNTCGAIQIAEGLKDMVKRNKGNIYIISKKQIRPNFIKEIYSVDRETGEIIPGSRQCTGDTYYISPAEEPDKLKRERKIKALWKQHYRFFGMQEFPNFVDLKVKKQLKENYAEYFSNSLFIIDEAHNLTGVNKSKTEEQTKKKKREKTKRKDEKLLILKNKQKLSSKNKTGHESLSESLSENESLNDSLSYQDFDGNMKIKLKKSRQSSENGILTVLHDIIKGARNLKFILLSATPIKDDKRELIDILDILRHNDGFELVDEAKLFPNDYSIDREYLKKVCKGYISYVRGENPITFPKLNIVGNYKPKPDLDEYGNGIPNGEHIKHIDLYKCYMSKYQYDCYYRAIALEIGKKKHSSNNNNSNSNSNSNSSNDNERSKGTDLIGRQLSNIIFPHDEGTMKYYGNDAFESMFIKNKAKTANAVTIVDKKTNKSRKQGVKYQESYSFKDEKKHFDKFIYKGINLEDTDAETEKDHHLGTYSTKFNHYIHNIINNFGLAYTYSDFLGCGAYMIAIILEINGYKKYAKDTNRVTNFLTLKTASCKKYVNDHLRCICGKFKTDDIHRNQNQNQGNRNRNQSQNQIHSEDDPNIDKKKIFMTEHHRFIQATYVLFTGNSDKSMEEELISLNSIDNKYTEIIKIIVGTRVSGEGVDYKRINSVHIIDPWHNFTRLFQAIGRALRHCSHSDLLEIYRIVNVYNYCAVPPPSIVQNRRETSDEKIYRRVERKDIMVKKIERILKTCAIDCQINKANNIYLNDIDGTRSSDYTEKEYKCVGNFTDTKINNDTYNIKFDNNLIKTILYSVFCILYSLIFQKKIRY